MKLFLKYCYWKAANDSEEYTFLYAIFFCFRDKPSKINNEVHLESFDLALHPILHTYKTQFPFDIQG